MGMWGRYASKPALGAPIDWAHPLAQGLAMALPLSEGAGLLAADATGRPNSGTPGAAAGWGASPWGGAVTLPGTSGTSNSISCGNDPSIQFGAGPFSALARFMSNTFSGIQVVAWHGGTAAPEWYMRMASSTTITIAIGGTALTPGVGTLVAGTWHTIGVTRDTLGNYLAYWDGRQVGATTATANVNSTAGLYLGYDVGATTRNLNGAIDCYLSWTRALSGPEMMAMSADPYQVFARPYQRLFRAAAAAPGAGMIHYLRRRRRTA